MTAGQCRQNWLNLSVTNFNILKDLAFLNLVVLVVNESINVKGKFQWSYIGLFPHILILSINWSLSYELETCYMFITCNRLT